MSFNNPQMKFLVSKNEEGILTPQNMRGKEK